MTAAGTHAMPEGGRLSVPFYLTVGLIAGAIIAYQIAIMRIFSIGTWAHFGSFVVSIAMLGFGVMSAVMCIGTGIFQRRWGALVTAALLAFGPLMVLGNTLAQASGFNPIALASDPEQKFKLFHLFVFYFMPFLPGALFLGLVFLRGQTQFNKVYFADLVGSGLCGLAFLGGTYLVAPDWIIMIPVAMWLVGALIWFGAARQFVPAGLALALTAVAVFMTASYVQIDVNQFKGVSYAQKFPDSKRIYRDYGPFGFLEIFASSYFHFAPGLSDNAALNLEQMPKNAYLGLYIDSDGPIGLIKDLSKEQSAYFEYLPMSLPYALKKTPEVFVVQLGGGISTKVALHMGAKRVVVAEGNPALLRALRDAPAIRKLTGDPLRDKRVTVIPYDGRLYVRGQRGRFDVIDLSLSDSTGLSHPGGSAIHEKYNYTIETVRAYMQALKPGGILSITLWNKEDPPKSVPKLFATVLKAAAAEHGGKIADKLFITHVYLSTVTVLYKRNGFTAADLATMTEANDDLSFVALYYPGFKYDAAGADKVFEGYRASYIDIPGRKVAKDRAKRPNLSATNLYRLMLHHMIAGRFDLVREKYVFDTRPLNDDRPYFAAYIKVHEIPKFLNQLDSVSDEWGYLLLWATLVIAAIFGAVLMLVPVIWGWRTIFSRQRGKAGTILYFLCLGIGYIIVEVGLISKFTLALANPTISASVLITGMLLFSGLGSLYAGRYIERCRTIMPRVFVGIGILLALGAMFYDVALDAIGTWPYWTRIGACLLLLAPPAFLMGFPFPTAMTMLARLGKERFFIWAWGINGSFSVVGAVSVPLVAVLFGQSTVILAAAALYLIALPAFFAVLRPPEGAAAA
ncbi:MAG TPA: hypothetical protein VM325_02170 [Alphaproteobacteria bacterium]|nr:hypothetical protein [Alphaproteobacteria bacterium]